MQTFYCNILSCVTNNGFASDFFNLERGVRQGCPLSGMLFILGIEILALAIIQNSKIQGIAVGSRLIKITPYADDTTVFLRNQESMNVLLELPEKFARCSQLKINPRSQKLYGSENGRIEQIPLSTLSGQRNLSLYSEGYTFRTAKEHVIN